MSANGHTLKVKKFYALSKQTESCRAKIKNNKN